MRRMAVFCGSSSGRDGAFGAVADAVGRGLAARGIGLVYGGGRLGLMGRLADAALGAGGEAIGVIPQALVAAEAAHLGLTRLEVVDTMHARKARMAALAEAFIVLPGGIGTLEEMFEVLSWSQLGYHAKPVGLLAVGDFWAPLLVFLDGLVDAGFVTPAHRANLLLADGLDALLDAFGRFVPGPPLARIAGRDL